MNCPTCNSHSPNLHPAIQSEGEIQPCKDEYHYKMIDGRCVAHKRAIPCEQCVDLLRVAFIA